MKSMGKGNNESLKQDGLITVNTHCRDSMEKLLKMVDDDKIL